MIHQSPLIRALAAGFAMALAPLASAQNEPPPAEPATPPAAEQPVNKPPASDFPSAESLFEKHLEAVGGKDAIFAVTSRRLSGTIKVYTSGQSQPIQSGILRIQAKAPNVFLQEVIFPGQSTSIRSFDGKAGWITDADGASRPMQNEELERVTVASRFYAEADYRNHFKSMNTVDRQPMAEDDTANIVEVEHFSGRTEAFIFSENSGLLIGVIGVRQVSENEEAQFRRSYEEYTDFGDGILLPKIVREVMGNYMFEMTFNSAETGVDISTPARPEGIPDADLSGYQK